MRQRNGGEKGQKEKDEARQIAGARIVRDRKRRGIAKNERENVRTPRENRDERDNCLGIGRQVDVTRCEKIRGDRWNNQSMRKRESRGCPTPTTTTVAKVANSLPNNNALVNVRLSGLAKTPALFIVHSLPLRVILFAFSPLICICIWHPSVNACLPTGYAFFQKIYDHYLTISIIHICIIICSY